MPRPRLGVAVVATGPGRRAMTGRGRRGGRAAAVLGAALTVVAAAPAGATLPARHDPPAVDDATAVAAGECRAPMPPGLHTVDVVQQGVSGPSQPWVKAG